MENTTTKNIQSTLNSLQDCKIFWRVPIPFCSRKTGSKIEFSLVTPTFHNFPFLTAPFDSKVLT
ncbi:CLUMA_CG006668, isoform A [Clunio marinus]|uniref:CLUMA_CG006668, isoform A n=1 Tax=Clunio marinus TaxID=568069 RepID=A0A1J1HYD3_9DIPT|nr:CLUMA_CG006668, isoform A [Clunio marinus]